MAYSPRLLGQPAKPSQIGEKLAKTWDILSPYVTGPVDAWKGLMEADLNTLLYDKGAGGRKAVEDAFNVAGTVTGGSSVVPKPSNALNMGIKAYHGSPHSFDKFDMSKIGTGEGAQAYGHGLYFAEQEGIAKSYRDGLSAAKRPVVPEDPALLERIKTNNQRADYLSEQQQYASSQAEFDDIANKIAAIEDENKGLLGTKGHMYEVNIDADPNAFLDWDKPLSEQPEAVRRLAGWTPEADGQYRAARRADTDALAAALEGDGNYTPTTMPRPLGTIPMDATGDSLYRALVEKQHLAANPPVPFKASEAATSKKLAKAGIPGIKYLDAGSRGAGDGTRNYVVFDDKLISIVRKYGIAGASAMLGYNVLEGMDKAQADTLNKADFDYRADEFYRQGGV